MSVADNPENITQYNITRVSMCLSVCLGKRGNGSPNKDDRHTEVMGIRENGGQASLSSRREWGFSKTSGCRDFSPKETKPNDGGGNSILGTS